MTNTPDSSPVRDAADTAITNVTLIDGTGTPPRSGVTIVVSGGIISAVGESMPAPETAEIVDGTGTFVTPGLIDTNVHIDMQFEMFPLLVYSGVDEYLKNTPSTEAAQIALKHGVTTIVDTHGPLEPLTTLRDRIAAGDVVGPRLLVAGHIMGYDGFYSVSERFSPTPWPWQLDHGKWFTQGVGPELTLMYPDEAQEAVERYIDLGPDLIKIGVSAHTSQAPIPLLFSPRTLEAMVATAHARGRIVQAHATSVESFRAAVDAGIDLITHAEYTNGPIRRELAEHVARSDSYFALFAHKSLPQYLAAKQASPAAWRAHEYSEDDGGLAAREAVRAITPDRDRRNRMPAHLRSHNPPEPTRANQKALIDAGAKISLGTDSMSPMYEDIVGYNRSFPDMGVGTVDALEGLVTALGMTPARALVVATRDNADAIGLLDQIGTVEAGKAADLLILEADPLADIGNIRTLKTVFRAGKPIDPRSLPAQPRFYQR